MSPEPSNAAATIVKWPRGRCEHWITPRTMCGKRGRWLVNNEIRCGEHKHSGRKAAE